MAQAQAGTVDAVDALIAGVEERLRRQLRLERTNLLSALAEETPPAPAAGAASAEAAAPPPPPIVFLVEEAAPAPTAEPEAARQEPAGSMGAGGAFTELLGDELVGKDGPVPTATAIAGKKAVGLYFSAHWCPPCRGFTPQLVAFCVEIKSSTRIQCERD